VKVASVSPCSLIIPASLAAFTAVRIGGFAPINININSLNLSKFENLF
jgi:hypothetical protein